MQADSHELLMGILNSGPAIAANVNSLIQYDVLTKGRYVFVGLFSYTTEHTIMGSYTP